MGVGIVWRCGTFFVSTTFAPAPPMEPFPSKVIEMGAGPSTGFPSRATDTASAGSVASVISFRPSGDFREKVSAEAEAQAARAATARRVFFMALVYHKPPPQTRTVAFIPSFRPLSFFLVIAQQGA